MPKALLIAQGPTSLSALKSLAEHFSILGVVRDAGESDEVVALALKLGARVSGDESLKGLRALVRELRPDVAVISSYNRIVGSDLLDVCPFVNVHYAELPRYRGRAVINWAMINQEPFTAITIHEVAPGLDAGRILFQRTVSIGPEDTVTDLYERLNDIQLRELGRTVSGFLNGEPGLVQDESMATYACARVPEDGLIDWSQSAKAIDRLVRALTPPFPGAFTHYNDERLVIRRARLRQDPPVYVGAVPGRVAGLSKQEGWVDVLTGDGILRLLEVSGTDGVPRPAAAVITSTRDTLGLSPLRLLERINELETRLARLKRPGS